MRIWARERLVNDGEQLELYVRRHGGSISGSLWEPFEQGNHNEEWDEEFPGLYEYSGDNPTDVVFQPLGQTEPVIIKSGMFMSGAVRVISRHNIPAQLSGI